MMQSSLRLPRPDEGADYNPVIDWSRVAAPQTDGYDVDVALSFIEPFPKADRIQLLNRSLDPSLSNAPVDHPNIKLAENLLSLWPEGYASFQRLIYCFYPLDTQTLQGRGSTCGSDESRPGEMYATVYSVAGLADAFVHEMGHQKLRYLGIKVEHAERLITNSPDELYVSPLRKDKLRPMTAVFHALFSYSYVTQLDLIMYEHEQDRRERAGHLDAIQTNYNRLREGESVLRPNLKTDEDGKKFFASYLDWLDRILVQCKVVLARSSSIHPDTQLSGTK